MSSYLDMIWNYNKDDFIKLFPEFPKTTQISDYRILAIEKYLPLFNDIDKWIVSNDNFISRVHLDNLYDIFNELQLKFSLQQIWTFDEKRIKDIIILDNYYTIRDNLHLNKITVSLIFFERNNMLKAKANLYVSNKLFTSILSKYQTLDEGLFNLKMLMNIPEEIKKHELNPFELNCLSGPTCLVLFKPNTETKILLLGEEHKVFNKLYKYKNVYPIHRWIYDLINNLNEQIDMLLEITPFKYETAKNGYNVISEYNKELEDYNAPLSSIISIFSNVNNDNFNLYPVDLRDMIFKNKNPLLYVFINKDMFLTNLNNKFVKNNRKNIINYFIGYKTDEKTHLIFNKFIEMLFLRQTNINYKKEMNDYIEKMKLITDELMLSVINFNKNKFYDSYLFAIERTFYRYGIAYDNIIDNLFMSQIDMFCILKLLKLIESTKNIIIYTGEDHTSIYNDFLIHYFDKDPELVKISTDAHIIFDTPFNFTNF